VMEDMLLSFPSFMVQKNFVFFLSGCSISDLWIPEVVQDLLSSCPFFMVHHSDIFCLLSPYHHINPFV
jgi:hypothetical protein